MPKIRKVIMNCQDWEKDKNNFEKVSKFGIDVKKEEKGGEKEIIMMIVSLGIFGVGALGVAFLLYKSSKSGQNTI